jgi:hypothetical protein
MEHVPWLDGGMEQAKRLMCKEKSRPVPLFHQKSDFSPKFFRRENQLVILKSLTLIKNILLTEKREKRWNNGTETR